MIIETDNGDTINTHEPDRGQVVQPDKNDPAEYLLFRAEQADLYIRSCLDDGRLVNVDAMPLLYLREAIDLYRRKASL